MVIGNAARNVCGNSPRPLPSRRCEGAPGIATGAIAHCLTLVCVAVTVGAVCFSVWERCGLARRLTWQCDELPVLARFTSLGSVATTEEEAQAFTPTLYSLRTGVVRSLRVPRYIFSAHTTTHFWTSLTLNLFGYGPLAGRLMPLVWGCIAIVASAYASWLCVRSVPGACLAALIVAFSPAATAYSAQARGYGEAMALVPLTLIALELWRRRSTSWIRAAVVALLVAQLSLTVYTMWIYWVFPVLILAIVILPSKIAGVTEKRAARAMLVCLLLVMCIWMGIFTAERWKSLSFASTYGVRFESGADVLLYVTTFADRLIPLPLLSIPLIVAGAICLPAAPVRWWGGAMLAGVTLPLFFGIANGSAGYMRNLFYIVGPASILASVGLGAVLGACSRRWGGVSAGCVAVAALVGTFAGGATAHAGTAGELLLPDWGLLVRAVESGPKTVGPRLFCPCAANHWQINWYRDRSDDEAITSLSDSGRIEVVMGAQLGDDDQPLVFRHNKQLDGIRPEPLPSYLARVTASQTTAGVQLRRWEGVKVGPGDLPGGHAPVLVLAKLARSPSRAEWRRLLNDRGGYDAGVVPFKERVVGGGELHMLMAPSWFAGRIEHFLRRELGVADLDVSWIALRPLPGSLGSGSPP